MKQQYTEEQLLVLVSLFLRYRSLAQEVLERNQSYLSLKELAEMTWLKQKRLHYLMHQYISNQGKFLSSPTEKKLQREPLELVDHVLVESGAVYSFGKGDEGQLGHGDEEHRYVPTLVEALQQHEVVEIQAGVLCSVVRTAAGELLQFGSSVTDEDATNLIPQVIPNALADDDAPPT